jgi:hypothetical protein
MVRPDMVFTGKIPFRWWWCAAVSPERTCPIPVTAGQADQVDIQYQWARRSLSCKDVEFRLARMRIFQADALTARYELVEIPGRENVVLCVGIKHFITTTPI